MQRYAGFLTALLVGCSTNMAGSWEVVEVHPEGASFPFRQVSFDDQGKYTATGMFDADGRMTGKQHTTTGQAQRKGRELRMAPSKGTAVVYQTRRRLDGRLELVLKVPGQDRPLTAVLAPPNP